LKSAVLGKAQDRTFRSKLSTFNFQLSTLMPDLQPAIAAAQNGMWSAVIEYLQVLPIVSTPDDSISDDLLAWRSQVLDLTLQVLLQGDFEEQWEIAKILPKLGEIAIQPLLNLLNDCGIDLEDRWFVARILGEFNRPQVVTALVESIELNQDPDLVEMATSALAKIGTPAISALTDLLHPAPGKDCSLEHRLLAVTALAQIRHSQTIEPLLGAADDPDPQIRTLAIEALGSFHDPRISPLLLAKLTDIAASVRQAAVTALCLRPDLAAEFDLVAQLRPLLFDLNLAVCEATALGLARLPDERVVELLKQVAIDSHTPPTLRSQAILALGWIGTEAAIVALGSLLVAAPGDVASEIIASVGKTEHERIYASQVLLAYLATDRSATRSDRLSASHKQEIATALGNLGNIQAVSDLVQLLGDPDDRVKFHAIAAMVKLSPVMPPQILELASRSDLEPELQIGVRLCLAHWKV
jgi:HEAT repeat protein